MRSSQLLSAPLSLLVVVKLAAQPVLTEEDLLSVGDQAMVESYFDAVDVSGLTNPGPTGHWDFTREFGVPSDIRIECLEVGAGPVDAAVHFPGADRVVKRTTLPPRDLPPELFPESSLWHYYSCDPNGQTLHGFAFPDPGELMPPTVMPVSPPTLEFPSPLTLGDEWTQAYRVENFVVTDVQVSSTVDAWGTATLPGIGMVNCLRVNQEVINQLVDTSVSPPAVLSAARWRTYSWLAEGIGVVAVILSPFSADDSIPAPGFTTAQTLELLVDFTPAPTGPQFVRGEINGDGTYNVSDAVGVIRHVVGVAPADCEAAADLDDDGTVSISDALYSLRYLFNRGPAPAAPFPECGSDPTEDLACEIEGCP